MNRLINYIKGTEDEIPDYKEYDVKKLKEHIPELFMASDYMIYRMYSDFSDTYAASWLIIDEETIESFRSWLL